MHSNADMAALFSALADPTRVAIVERLLAHGEQSVGDLAAPFDISMPAVSKHLTVLERAGIIERRVDRQRRLCCVRPQPMAQLDQWMSRYRAFWSGSLSRLDSFLQSQPNKDDME